MSEGSSGPSAALRRRTSARPIRRGPGQEVLATARRRRRAAAVGDHDRLERRERRRRRPRAWRRSRCRGSRVTVTSTRAPAARQDVGRLGALEPRVHRDEDRAGREDAEDGHHPLGAVEAPDRHPVAGLDPGCDQRGAEAVGPRRPARRTSGWSPRRVRPPGRRTAPRRAASMAGMVGQAAPARPAHAATTASVGRRRLRMLLFPYNNVTFKRRPHKKPRSVRPFADAARGRRDGHDCARAVLRPLRLRNRRRSVPGLEAAARRGAALLTTRSTSSTR